MSIALLRKLAKEKLPFTVTGGDAVDAVYILSIAGHINAAIEPVVRTPLGWLHPSAVVHSITRSGRRMLKAFPPD